MRIAVLTVTESGKKKAKIISENIKCDVYTSNYYTDGIINFTKGIYKKYDAFVFICAAGIAVRSIAPLIINKTVDPAVIVTDDKANFAISLLSGHMGGGNKLCIKIAEILKAMPVITTATDINNIVSFDIFALENNMSIENINELKYISGEMLFGGNVGLIAENCSFKNLPSYIKLNSVLTNNIFISHKNEVFESFHKLILRPKNIVVGIGCKKGVSCVDIEASIQDLFYKQNISMTSLKCLATIELKKYEQGINEFCLKKRIYSVLVPNQEIIKRESEFKTSDFVKKTVGVGSVAEACAVCAFENTKIICSKTIYKSITLALGVVFEEYTF